MTEDKKAKVMLYADKVIDIDKLLECKVSNNSMVTEKASSYVFEPESLFLTEEEKRGNQIIRMTMDVVFYGKAKDLGSIYNASKFKVVPFDQYDNIIE